MSRKSGGAMGSLKSWMRYDPWTDLQQVLQSCVYWRRGQTSKNYWLITLCFFSGEESHVWDLWTWYCLWTVEAPDSDSGAPISFSLVVNNDNAPPQGFHNKIANCVHLVLNPYGLVCHNLWHSFLMPYIIFHLAQKYVCPKQSTSCCPQVTAT